MKRKHEKIKFSSELLLKISKAASRNIEIEQGLGGSNHRVHKDKSKYTRKTKHKK